MIIRCFLFCLALELSGTCTDTYDISMSSYITSPSYPQRYGNNVDCRWTIAAFHQRTIALNFTQFHTESCCDKLSIYSGTNVNAIHLETLSGTSYPSQILFTGKRTYLKFTSDQNGGKKGFRILLKSYGK